MLLAFVNPLLPRSADFHPVLHLLRETFDGAHIELVKSDGVHNGLSGAADVRIAFADVRKHREFIHTHALRELPALFVYGAALPTGSFVPLNYSANKTAAAYACELNALAHLVSAPGLQTRPLLRAQAWFAASVRDAIATGRAVMAAVSHATDGSVHSSSEAVLLSAAGGPAPVASAADSSTADVNRDSSAGGARNRIRWLAADSALVAQHVAQLLAQEAAKHAFMADVLSEVAQRGSSPLAARYNGVVRQLLTVGPGALMAPEVRSQLLMQTAVLAHLAGAVETFEEMEL